MGPVGVVGVFGLTGSASTRNSPSTLPEVSPVKVIVCSPRDAEAGIVNVNVTFPFESAVTVPKVTGSSECITTVTRSPGRNPEAVTVWVWVCPINGGCGRAHGWLIRPSKAIANALSAGFHLVAQRALPRPVGSSERVTR